MILADCYGFSQFRTFRPVWVLGCSFLETCTSQRGTSHCPVPEYYREFITTIGVAEFQEIPLIVGHPYIIAFHLDETREIFRKYWSWDEATLSQEYALECIPCFANNVGHITAFHPSEPNKIFIFEHWGNKIWSVSSFVELCQWYIDHHRPLPSIPLKISVFHDLEELENHYYSRIFQNSDI